jgi:hypothetical protein
MLLDADELIDFSVRLQGLRMHWITLEKNGNGSNVVKKYIYKEGKKIFRVGYGFGSGLEGFIGSPWDYHGEYQDQEDEIRIKKIGIRERITGT